MWLRKRLITIALVAVGGLMAAAPSAFGAESTNASCVGAGSSALAPGQQDIWAPGTRAEISHYVNSLGEAGREAFLASAHDKGSAADCFPNGPPLPPG